MEKQDPEFATLLREYKEGILLYQAEQEQVWNRVAPTDSSLHLYFDNNRDRFTFPDRVVFTELRAASAEVANDLYARVRSGKSFEQIVKEDSVRLAQPYLFVAHLRQRQDRIQQDRTEDHRFGGRGDAARERYPLCSSRHSPIRPAKKWKPQEKPIARQRIDQVKNEARREVRHPGGTHHGRTPPAQICRRKERDDRIPRDTRRSADHRPSTAW